MSELGLLKNRKSQRNQRVAGASEAAQSHAGDLPTRNNETTLLSGRRNGKLAGPDRAQS